jgi:hypothetical protein
MKLWECYATGIDYHPHGLVVAETEDKAKEKFTKQLDEDDIWYGSVYAHVVEVVDGYGIEVITE